VVAKNKKTKRIDAWVHRHAFSHICECGCEELIEIKREHYRSGPPRFIKGHNFEGDYNPKSGIETPTAKTYWDRLSEEERVRRLSLLTSFPKGPEHPNWVGGEIITDKGYRLIRLPEHPRARDGYVPEHRLIVEMWIRENCPDHFFLERIGGVPFLSRTTIVHHRDENKLHNELSNLILMKNQAAHLRWHMTAIDEGLKFEKFKEDIFCPWIFP
jgi:hypothetical protein